MECKLSYLQTAFLIGRRSICPIPALGFPLSYGSRMQTRFRWKDSWRYAVARLIAERVPISGAQYLTPSLSESVSLTAASLSFRKGKTSAADKFLAAAARHDPLGNAAGSRRKLVNALVGEDVAGSIGHIGLALGSRAKLAQLGLGPEYSYSLRARNTANAAILSYFTSTPSENEVRDDTVRVSDDPPKRAKARVRVLWVPTYIGLLNVFDAVSLAERLWEQQSRAPLLHLTESHERESLTFLREKGLPVSSWFVTLHVRDSSGESHNPRNASIEDYAGAIDLINSRGGWVIRLGGTASRPCPGKMVVDLRERPPAVDAFSLARARFVIATSSGPNCIPPLFGTPMLWTNATGFGAQMPYFANTRVLPQRIAAGRREPLSFDAMRELGILGVDEELAEPLRNRGFQWMRNSNELIREATASILDGELQTPITNCQLRIQQKLLEAGNFGQPVVSRVACEALL